MRIAVLADIHGNYAALTAVDIELDHTPVDRTIVAGDIALFGPHPDRCLRLVMRKQWEAIAGNTDRMIVEFEARVASGELEPNGTLGKIVSWTRDQLGEEALQFMAGLPPSATVHSQEGAGDLLILHGTPRSDEIGLDGEESDERLKVHVQDVKAYAIVGAHTHKSFGRRVGGVLIANAGSVGRSYEGKPGRATYVVLEDRTGVWALEIRHLSYDMRGNLRDIQNKGVPLPFFGVEAKLP